MERLDFDKRELLLNYRQYPRSKACYLDGRYFNIVFDDYPGLIRNPLYIKIDEDGELDMDLPQSRIVPSKDYFGLLRVVVTSKTMRHSLIVVFDYEHERAYIYNPDVHHPELNDLLMDNIISFLSGILDYEYFEIPEIEYIEKDTLKCTMHGVCNALVIFYALYFIKGLEFTDRNVQEARRFMSAVEANYDLPSTGEPDIEFLTDQELLGTTSGALLGAGTGLLLSGGNPAIGLIGAGVGAGIGYGLSQPRYQHGYDGYYYGNRYPYEYRRYYY